MSENFNIENLFNKSFNGFESKPSSDTWDSIDETLNATFPETTYSNKFKDFAVQPTEKVWKGIVATLWLDSFLKFSINRFNIYYAASIIAALFIAFNYVNLGNKNNSSNKNNIASVVKSEDNINLENNIDKKNNTSITESELVTNPVVDDTTKKASNETAIVKKTDKVNNNITAKEDYYIESYENQNQEVRVINNYITDTVRIHTRDTFILRDTVFMEVKKDPLAFVASPWSMDFYYNPLYTSSSLNGPDDILKSINDHTSNAYSWSMGVNVNYKLNNFYLQTGLAFTKFSEKFEYSEETIEINKYEDRIYGVVGEYTYIEKHPEWIITGTNNVPIIDTISSSYEVHEYTVNDLLIIDTVWSYQTDTIIVQVIDSMEIIHYDTITALKYDSLDVIVIDTIKTRSFYEFVNRYTYMEIPLIVNYELQHNKLSYVFGGGLITGIFLNAQGKGISVKDEVVSLNDLPFMKLNLSGTVNFGVHYHINTRMSLISEAVYRRSFNSIYNRSYFLEQKFNSFGIRLGMRYRF